MTSLDDVIGRLRCRHCSHMPSRALEYQSCACQRLSAAATVELQELRLRIADLEKQLDVAKKAGDSIPPT